MIDRETWARFSTLAWLLAAHLFAPLGCGDSSEDGSGDEAQADGGSGASGGAAAGAAGAPDGDAGADTASGRGGAAGAPGSDGGASNAMERCPEPVECEEVHPEEWGVLLEAEAFGADAEFTAMAGTGVLVVADGIQQLVRFEFSDTLPQGGLPHSLWAFPEGRSGIALADARGSGTNGVTGVFVLACDENECGVLHAPYGDAPESPVLAEWEVPEFPDGFIPQGLAVDGVSPDGSEATTLCAYGNGYYCVLEDHWEPIVAADAGVEILDVLLSDVSVILGAGGRWWRRDLWQEWLEQAPLEPAPRRIGQFGESVVLFDDDVVWQVGDGDATSCAPPFTVSAAVSNRLVSDEGEGVLYRTGDSEGQWCWLSETPLSGEVIAQTTAPCGASTNPRLLTRSAVIGANTCVYL